MINAASLDPEGGYKYYRDLFLRYGALEANRIPVDINHSTTNSDPDVIKLINQQTGFFFGGGEPQRVIDLFVYANGSKTPALLALRRLFEKGAVISGTSAGTECQPSTVTVKIEKARPSRENSHRNGCEPRNEQYSEVRPGAPGESASPDCMQHPSQQLHGKLTNSVIGQFGVMFIDVSRNMIDMYSNRYPLRGIYLHYLTHGDEIGLKKMDITFSTTKMPMKNNERFSRALTSSSIFGDDNNQIEHVPEFNRISASLFDARFDRSTFGDSVESNPRFHLILSRDSQDSEGWIERRTKIGQRDNMSYRNVHLEIHELF
ncbi:hypothetical protein FSP39_023383 [Pinctada imbricata]|uniref:Uncharacterized protein n=1 Tax=Pinctada imbricata TaxID=66713 RepID=A0AA88YBN6_PINIB|nr:hypothetical protein FSP39_023383 [Pinctada imbricata]